jgi:arylsulfatase A-like enzyme
MKAPTLLLSFLCLLPLFLTAQAEPKEEPPYNVLFIICDDLNDYVSGIGGQRGHAATSTPHLDRFGQTATQFPMAYTNNPVCAPSRSSLFYGMYHQTSGSLFWEEWYNSSERAGNSFTLNRFFKEHGYTTIGSGKVNHHMWKGYNQRRSSEFELNRDIEWSHYAHMTDYGPFWGTSGKDFKGMPDVPSPFRDLAKSVGSTGGIDDSYGSMQAAWESPKRKDDERFFYGGAPYWGAPFRYVNEDDRDPTPDERNAAWAVAQLKQFEKQANPFFLAVGFVRPHTPLHAPQKYFDRFPLEPGGIVDQFIAARILEGDIEDTHMHGLVDMSSNARNKGPRYYEKLLQSYDNNRLQALRTYAQAYLACVAAVDDNIGEILTYLEQSPLADNTIVVVTSDHGYHIGEKEWLFKASPWEESCRVPLLIRVPGMTQPGIEVKNIPVSLVDLYPTLVDLCGLPQDNRMNSKGAFLDGYSLRPLIENPYLESSDWTGHKAALTLVHNPKGGSKLSGHHLSIRTKDYRYIRYSNGKEELYNHLVDPDEWHNVIGTDKAATQYHRQLLKDMLKDMGNNRNRFNSPVAY